MKKGKRKFSVKNKYKVVARKNEEIRAVQVRVSAEEGESLGIMLTAEALKLAKDRGLDLILISEKADPPVAKITSFDKYRYQESKKMKKADVSSKASVSEQKRVQISVREAEGDLKTKASRVNKFLEQGSRVEILVRLRGRENQNKEFAREKLEQFLTIINPEHKVLFKSAGGYAGKHPDGRPKGVTINAIVTLKK
ncbi:MAG: translation initiation factor IF-3 [bacterium]|nr:translation initiation factor IF-3 [bacterium]